MALIECPKCKAKISDKAFSCPKCGHQFISSSKNMKVYFFAAIIIICCFGVFLLFKTFFSEKLSNNKIMTAAQKEQYQKASPDSKNFNKMQGKWEPINYYVKLKNQRTVNITIKLIIESAKMLDSINDRKTYLKIKGKLQNNCNENMYFAAKNKIILTKGNDTIRPQENYELVLEPNEVNSFQLTYIFKSDRILNNLLWAFIADQADNEFKYSFKIAPTKVFNLNDL